VTFSLKIEAIDNRFGIAKNMKLLASLLKNKNKEEPKAIEFRKNVSASP